MGNIFGELALYEDLDSSKNNEKAVMLENVVVCVIEAEQMKIMIEKHGSLKNQLLKLHGLRIRELQRNLEDLLYKDSEPRIKEFVLNYITEFGVKKEGILRAKNLLSHKDIAQLTNSMDGKIMKMKKRKILLISLLISTIFSFGYIKYYNMNINDIGLKVLGWVKKIKGNSVDLETINNAESPTMKHDDWTTLLQKHVTESGQVNYQGFIQDSVLFQKYLTDLTAHPTGKNWSEKEKLAYWINAYNAFTVKLILDNYPLKSIKDIGDGLPMINSPWDIKFFKIGNTDFDLNTIEHEILRIEFNEPRIHFAINCASASCPKLRNEAFTAEQLNVQLDDQAQQFINNPIKNNITENEVQLSKIFDWFKSDFTKEKSLASFLQQYTDVKLSNDFKAEYLDYDWNLNE